MMTHKGGAAFTTSRWYCVSLIEGAMFSSSLSLPVYTKRTTCQHIMLLPGSHSALQHCTCPKKEPNPHLSLVKRGRVERPGKTNRNRNQARQLQLSLSLTSCRQASRQAQRRSIKSSEGVVSVLIRLLTLDTLDRHGSVEPASQTEQSAH